MGKDYNDDYASVTPQNTPYVRQRKILVGLCLGALAFNQMLCLILVESARGLSGCLLALVLLYGVPLFASEQKKTWLWSAILGNWLFYLLGSLTLARIGGLWPMLLILGAEQVILGGVAVLLFLPYWRTERRRRRKVAARRKRREERKACRRRIKK